MQKIHGYKKFLSSYHITSGKRFDGNSSPFSCQARLKSFVHAWAGIVGFFRSGPNAQIHLVASIVVLVLSVTLGISKWEAIAVVFCIVLVLLAEMFNTAIEKAMDFISMERHPDIRFIKDVAAGAVLISSIAASLVGAIVFIPKLISV